MNTRRFRKKPVVVEAFQMTAENRESNIHWPNWAHDAWQAGVIRAVKGFSFPVLIKTLEGDHECGCNDWIIKGIKGELYPCKPDIFEATYEEVTPEAEPLDRP